MTSTPPSLWKHPDFRRLWTSEAISLIGSQVTFLALPLTAVLTVDATPGEMGLLTAMSSLPPLLFGLPAGVAVDRRRRKPLIIMSDVGRAGVLSAIPAAWLLGILTIEWLYVVAFVTGTLSLIAGLAHGALLPAVVPREQLVDANGKLALTATVAEVGGPTLATTLIQLFTAPVAIAADAASYLLSALMLSRMRTKEDMGPGTGTCGRYWPEMVQGVRLALGEERLRALVGTRVLLNFFNAMLEAVFVLYIIRELGIAVGLIGIIFSIGGIGFLAGAVMPARLARRIGVGASMVLGIATVALSDLLVPLAAGAPVVVMGVLVGAQFFFGIGLTIFNVNGASLRQAIVPREFLGRVGATVRVLAEGMTPMGAIAGGALGSAIGLRETLILAACGELLAAAWLWFSPVRQMRELPAPLA
ncbi:MAG TPA: MFS transporter [Thermomicrobiales bacterium]|nr:MFS transporter [Thermomicrobiales bacterium]